jgi:hypothetical protein
MPQRVRTKVATTSYQRPPDRVREFCPMPGS